MPVQVIVCSPGISAQGWLGRTGYGVAIAEQ
jgi:hypothetical protein